MARSWCAFLAAAAGGFVSVSAFAGAAEPKGGGALTAAAQRRGVVPQPVAIEKPCCDVCTRAILAARRQLRPAPAWVTEVQEGGWTQETDVLHYDLDIEINPSAVTIAGRNTMRVRVLVNGLQSFQIQLDQAFGSPAMSIGGVPVTYTRGSGPVIDVALDRAYNAGEEFLLRIDYAGTPPTNNGLGSITFTTQAGIPLVHTLSEPYYANTWWPVKEDSTDKATADLAFTVPSNLSVASNGLLLGVDPVAGGKSKYRWRTMYQTSPYLFSFSTTNYFRFSDTWAYPGGTMPLEFFIYPQSNTTNNRNAWLQTKNMLTGLVPRFGQYPFVDEKYGIYQFSFGGGMEHQTMTGQGTFVEQVTSHELGHQWWGDMVTCATWSDIWLNEGWATYTEALWWEISGRNLNPITPGPLALHTGMRNRRPSTVDGTVYYFPPANDVNRMFSQALTYYKAGWVLHMMRHVVGETNFWNIAAQWRAQYEYSTATTADFQAVCEAVSGMDLDTYFSQWVYSPGAPLYSYGWRNVPIAGRHFVELYINQTQNAAWPTFDMPLDVVTTDGGGSTTHVVRNDARAEHLVFEVAAPITALSLDPDNWVLTASNVSPAFGKTLLGSIPEGPPKVIAAAPAPGTTTAPGGPSQVAVTFHRPVSTAGNFAGKFTLLRNSTPVGFNLSYAGGTQTVTLTPHASMGPGVYTLRIADTLTGSIAPGLALDGEVSGSTLPSGDGLPGGQFEMVFTVPTCSVADLATAGSGDPFAGPDGFITGEDFDVFINAFFNELRRPSDNALIADLVDGTGAGVPDLLLTGSDFDAFIAAFFAGC